MPDTRVWLLLPPSEALRPGKHDARLEIAIGPAMQVDDMPGPRLEAHELRNRLIGCVRSEKVRRAMTFLALDQPR